MVTTAYRSMCRAWLRGEYFMAFSEETKAKAYANAGGKCETCSTSLKNKTWHAHHKTSIASGGSDALSNCKVLCVSCHENTRTYGKH